MNNILLVSAAVVGGVTLSQLAPVVKAKVKKLLAGRNNNTSSVLLQGLSGVNQSVTALASGMDRFKYELDHIKGQLQSVDQELKKLKTDNGLIVSGMGTAEVKLAAVEKAAVNSVVAVNKLASLTSQVLDVVAGKPKANKGTPYEPIEE